MTPARAAPLNCNMGIKNLKSIVERVSPHARESHNVGYFKNSSFAIDSSIFLYRFLYSKGHLDQPHIVGFLNKVIYFLKNGITPLFVWDGIPPQEKDDVLSKRWENKKRIEEKISVLNDKIQQLTEDVTTVKDDDEEGKDLPFLPEQDELDLFIKNQELLNTYQTEVKKLSKQLIYVKKHHKEDVKELLDIIGIPHIAAKGEAEALCSQLAKEAKVNFVLSEDTDTLVHGSPNLIQNGTNNDEFILTHSDILMKGLKLTFPQFMDFCILCGCDYTCTIPKLGPVTAYNFITQWGSIEEIIANLPSKFKVPSEFNYKKSRELFLEEPSIPPGWQMRVDKIGNLDRWETNLLTWMTKKGFKSYQIDKYIQELKIAFRGIKNN